MCRLATLAHLRSLHPCLLLVRLALRIVALRAVGRRARFYPHAMPTAAAAVEKRRRVATSRWLARALDEFDSAVRVARRDGVT